MVREKKIRIKEQPFYNKTSFLLASLGFFLFYFIFLLPQGKNITSFEWVKIIVFVFLCILYSGIIINDPERTDRLKTITAISLVMLLFLLFYLYSGAKWNRLGYVFFNFGIMNKKSWIALGTGFLRTVELGVLSLIVAFSLGLFLAVLRTINNKVITFFVILYINIFRAIPVIVLASVVYYALPYLGISFTVLIAGIVTLGLNHSAFSSEIFRAGIESIHHGQIEAAKALGFNQWKILKIVILPQAIRVVIPPLTGQGVALLKETAICSTIGILELMRQALIVQAWTANPTPLILATIIYILFLVPLTRLSRNLEKRLRLQ
ncbi:MAG: amino acid ABC transporter permease [Thermotogota bacterium]|nr:amino acid ABC transporter permease [Thermotogota bacterium]